MDASPDTNEAADKGRKLPWVRELGLIAVLALVLNLVGNAQTSLWDRDEPRYAGCTREMWNSGDLTFPTFNGEPRYHKPVLIYWLMMGAYAVAGDNPFSARLVSVLAGTATVIVTWFFGRRLFGRGVARWAALILATAPIMVVESKLATTDATLLFFLIVNQFAVWELHQGRSRKWMAVYWISLALAVMTKGPVGPAILFAAGAASWLFGAPIRGYLHLFSPLWPSAAGLDEGRRLRQAWAKPGWLRVPRLAVQFAWLNLIVIARWFRANWGLMLFLLITSPWFILIGVRSGGAFYDVAFGYHVVRRATSGIETHGGFPGFYVALTIALFFPWSAFLPASLAAAWKQRKTEPGIAFLLGWILGPLVLLEIVRTKLIHYYLPAYPACALLIAWLVPQVARSEVNLRRWPMGRMSMGLLGGLGLAYSVGLLAGLFAFPGNLKWHCLPLAVLIAGGTIYAIDRLQSGRTERGVATLVGTWALVLFLIGGWFLPELQPYRLAPMVARKLQAMEETRAAQPALAGFKPPGVVYEFGEPLPLLEGKADILAEIRRNGPVATVLNPQELALIQRFDEFEVETDGEPLTGLNVETFRMETVHPVVVRERGSVAIQPREAPRVK